MEREREGRSLASVMEGMDTKDEVPDRQTRIVQRGSTQEDGVRQSEGIRARWDIHQARSTMGISGLGKDLVHRYLHEGEEAENAVPPTEGWETRWARFVSILGSRIYSIQRATPR